AAGVVAGAVGVGVGLSSAAAGVVAGAVGVGAGLPSAAAGVVAGAVGAGVGLPSAAAGVVAGAVGAGVGLPSAAAGVVAGAVGATGIAALGLPVLVAVPLVIARVALVPDVMVLIPVRVRLTREVDCARLRLGALPVAVRSRVLGCSQ